MTSDIMWDAVSFPCPALTPTPQKYKWNHNKMDSCILTANSQGSRLLPYPMVVQISPSILFPTFQRKSGLQKDLCTQEKAKITLKHKSMGKAIRDNYIRAALTVTTEQTPWHAFRNMRCMLELSLSLALSLSHRQF